MVSRIKIPAIQEVYFKNLFSVLSSDRGSRIFGKQSFLFSIREFQVEKPILSAWFDKWKTEPGKLYECAEPDANQEVVLLLVSALLCEVDLHPEITRSVLLMAAKFDIPNNFIHHLFSNRQQYLSEKSIAKRAGMLKTAYRNLDKEGKVRPEKAGRDESKFYIANQVTPEGLDELQRLLMAYWLGCHVAIDGPPGVGKTRCVLEAGDILGLNIYTKTCSRRTTESHIISYPVLDVRDGASCTAHVNGPLVCAMIEPGIFYGDEFNLLKEDVQKRLNSTFDERESIDRNDGVIIRAQPGFWGIISYNPSQNLASRDLEDSIADRFVHMNFGRWHPDFRAYVARRKSRSASQPVSGSHERLLSLQWRGISPAKKGFYVGTSHDEEIAWTDFFSGRPVHEEPAYRYQVYDPNSMLKKNDPDLEKMLLDIERSAVQENDLPRLISRFTDLLYSLSQTGKSPLMKKIGLSELVKEEDLELLQLHESSARIEVMALKHYDYLCRKGWNRYLAQSYAVHLVVDQVCYGQYRNKKLRNHTVYELVVSIAKAMKLFSDVRKFNTQLGSQEFAKAK